MHDMKFTSCESEPKGRKVKYEESTLICDSFNALSFCREKKHLHLMSQSENSRKLSICTFNTKYNGDDVKVKFVTVEGDED